MAGALKRLYSLYAPFYDGVVRMHGARRTAVETLELAAGDRVVIPGAGTGADLRHLPAGVRAVAGDISPGMLRRLRSRAGEATAAVEVREMDARSTGLEAGSFDAAILHLIVAVVPEPRACLEETVRLVRPGGRISILDKFAPDGRPVAAWRRVLDPLTRRVATSIICRLEDLLPGLPVEVRSREPAAFGGFFERILLERL
ncbi:MAG: class I SAM-dependent methyltransferase [Gemmatimonadales bacterium]|nr:MAG: class I SAM-dependent methyltransferase [Gemmatimonadales bacterium]